MYAYLLFLFLAIARAQPHVCPNEVCVDSTGHPNVCVDYSATSCDELGMCKYMVNLGFDCAEHSTCRIDGKCYDIFYSKYNCYSSFEQSINIALTDQLIYSLCDYYEYVYEGETYRHASCSSALMTVASNSINLITTTDDSEPMLLKYGSNGRMCYSFYYYKMVDPGCVELCAQQMNNVSNTTLGIVRINLMDVLF